MKEEEIKKAEKAKSPERRKSSMKEEDAKKAAKAKTEAEKAKSPEPPPRRKASQVNDEASPTKAKSPEAEKRKHRPSLKKGKEEEEEKGHSADEAQGRPTTAARAAELRQQEEILRKKEKKEEPPKEDERARRRREEEERVKKEEEEFAERRKKRKEEEEKRKKEEEESAKKEEERRAERKKKLQLDEVKRLEEEEQRKLKEDDDRRQKLEKRRQEQEKMLREEEERIMKEEADRREKRRQRNLEEEKAYKERQARYAKEEIEREERRRKQREEEEKAMREKELERQRKKEKEKQERRQRLQKELEEDERRMEEEEERRRERRKKKEEYDKMMAEEEERRETESRKRIETEKKKLEEELRGREEMKRRREEELKKQGEEFLRKEEERRQKRTEERKRWQEEEDNLDRGLSERHGRDRSKHRDKDRYGSLERRPCTPDGDFAPRRDPKRRPKFSTKLQDRQAVKGSRIRLTCNILYPMDEETPEIEWFKGGYPVREDERVKVVNHEGVACLELSHITRSDSGEYTCTARNRHGRVSTTCDLRVKGEEDQKPTPPTFTTSLRERYVTEDDQLVLSCHVMGYPQPKITWLKDADRLPASPRFQTSITEEGICKLIITSPRSADSGNYTCHAENRVYRDEISGAVQVQGKQDGRPDDSESPRFISELCDQFVEENGTLTLQVEVAGSPTPEVLWQFNGRLLHPSGKFRISATTGTHTLTVFQVTSKDLGCYSCRITNKYGQSYTMSTVSFGTPKTRREALAEKGEKEMKAPTFTTRPESMITVLRDEEIHLSCAVHGEPTPRVSWLKGTQDVVNTGRAHKTVRDNQHSVVIRGAQITDSGTYTVEAKNISGSVRAYCSVKVRENFRSRSYSPRGRVEEKFPTSIEEEPHLTSGRFIRDVPGKVGTPKARDVGRNWVSLHWTKPQHMGSVVVNAYKVEGWILGEEARWQEYGVSPIPSFDVYNLKTDREYLFRVTPRNKYGWGEAAMTPQPIRVGRRVEAPSFPHALPHHVRAMPGSSICIDAQVTGEPVPEIRWYKDGTYVDIQRYPRFSSFSTESSVSLRIDDLQWEDEGKYELEAVNPGGRVTSYARLTPTHDCSVLEAQERINSNLLALSRLDSAPSMAPHFTMRLRDRRVQLGFPVRLTCQIVGIPRPQVTWFKNDDLVTPDEGHIIWQEDGNFHTLEISNASHADASIYSACAVNAHGSILCSCRLIVDTGLRSYISPMFLKELEDESVREGDTILLETVVEAYPTIGIVWHRDGQRIRPSRKHSFSLNRDGIATLEIRSADYTDGGIYTCTAKNEMGHIESMCRVSVSCTDSDLSSKRRAALRQSKEPMFVRKPRALDAVEGEQVIIECEVAGEPNPHVTWLRDWLKPSDSSEGSRLQQVGAGPIYRLEIPSCRLEDAGAYSIVAKNEHGEARAVVSLQVYPKGVKVDLEGRPVKRGVMERVPVVTRPLQDIRCCDGDSVTLEAQVDAPKNANIRWEKQGKLLKLGGDLESEWDGSCVRLKIREVYPEDEGEYSCIILSDLGKAVTSATLIVEMADDKENDVTVQLDYRPDLSRRTTPSRTTPSRYSRSPSFQPRRRTPDPIPHSKAKRSHGPKFYYIPHDRIVEEGETVTFQCAVKGHPTPRAVWDKDSLRLPEGGRYKMEAREETRTLEIPKVTQQDAGLYRVTIDNDLGREQATARLDVIKASGNKYAGYVRSWYSSPLTPPQFTRSAPSSRVREGGRLHLTSEYRGSPLPQAKWYRNHELLPLCEDFVQTCDGRTASLEIPSVTSADAGTYTCVLVNDAGKTECSCEVVVEHHNDRHDQPPFFLRELQDLTVLDGDEVTLSVKLTGSRPMKVVWVRNDKILPDGQDFRHQDDGNGTHSLVVRDVFPEDAGVYICEAYNAHGGVHCYCRLSVHDPCAIQNSLPQIVGALTPLEVEEGSAARFSVTVHGFPQPSVSWYCDGRKLDATPRMKVEADSDAGIGEPVKHTLGILHALSTDSGVISVVASNCLGSDTTTTTLKVNPYTPLKPNEREATNGLASTSAASIVTSDSPAPRIRPLLKEVGSAASPSTDSAYGSVSLRDSTSACSSSLSNFSELEEDHSTSKDQPAKIKLVKSLKFKDEQDVQESANGEAVEDGVEEEEEEEETGVEILEGPRDVTVLKGQSATFTATFTGNPKPVVSWLKKEQTITDGGRYKVKTEEGRTSLTIHDVVQQDCDKYTIVVRNSLCAHAAFASLAVGSAPEPPADKPNFCEVTADSVTLSWYGPTYDGGSVVTGYTVEARKVGKEDWYTLISGCHSTSYIARGLEKNCQFEFRILAQNMHGMSEPSRPSCPITIQDPVDRPEEPECEEFDTTLNTTDKKIQSGDTFDKQYKLHEEVAKGRFGIVYRVTEKSSGRKRAAKIVKCIRSMDKEKVLEEITIMNALRHPKLLQLEAAFERGREFIMVMEYITGGELFERVVADDFDLTERDCILFVRQICEGVNYMHKNLIVHLDLKPENILCVTRTSHQIKLIDFGLARRFNPDDPCRVLFGTPEFIAPEVINYEPIGFASDMWSVGVICYVLLSGLSPFAGDSDAETFANITRAEFDFDDDAFIAISDDAKDFITSLLISRKEKRLTAEQCFNHPWLAQTEADMNKVVLSTDKLKKFIIRRKWQKTGNALRALGRITSLTNRRCSQPSSPTRLSPLPENQTQTQTPSSTPPSSSTQATLSKSKGCAPVTRPSHSIVSERSDSGISECSFNVEENSQNPQANQFGVTNSRAVTGCNVLKSGKTPSLDWQSSVDSAVCDDDYISKSSYSSSPRKISREGLIHAKSAAADTLMNAHSRI